MKIGFDAKRLFYNNSGLGNYSRAIIGSLIRFFPENEYFLYVTEMPTIDNAHPESLSFLDFSCVTIRLSTPDKPPISIFLFLKAVAKFRPWWRTWGMGLMAGKDGVDVFHGLSNEMPLDLPPGVRSICTIHDVIFKEFPGYYPFIDRIIYDWKTQKALKNSGMILLTSVQTKLALDKYYPNFLGKKSVVYQPIHPDFYAVQHTTSPKKPAFLSVEAGSNLKSGSTNYFVYQSSFTERKNHLALVEAFSLIQKQIDWNLILVGIDGPMRLQIEQQIAAVHLEKRIQIIVDAHHSLLLTIVMGASGFVYPSMSEGFGIPLAEAAVAGLPMAVSRIPIFIEIAEDTPVYFHPNNIEEMAAAMMQISLPEEQVRQRQKVGAILDKIDSKTIANNLMQAYLNPS